jgi:hypothetical protein
MRGSLAFAYARPVLRHCKAMRAGAALVSIALAWWLVLACASPAAAPRQQGRPERPSGIEAQAWPEADALFRGDPRWLGGDAAVSIALDGERVLWLFGDSFVAAGAEQPAASRRGARLLRNSVAVQRGRDPSRAQLRFFWGTAPDGSPASYFAAHGTCWLWPGHGLYLRGVLTLFALRVCPDASAGGLGFRVDGWTASRVQDARVEPDAWRPVALQTPATFELKVGAAVILHGEHVYAYAVREPGDHAVVLLRWPLADFERGDLMRPEYFGGEARGFGTGPPAVVMERGATELSITAAPRGGYVAVQVRGFGASPIALRFAAQLVGPFGALQDAYAPPEMQRSSLLIYAARAHPELTGADLVLTYNTNTLDQAVLLDDLSLYFPRFVRLSLGSRALLAIP